MNQQETIEIRAACPEDYDGLYELWCRTSGFGIRSVDDSRENIGRFLLRNPGISAVAVCGGHIIGDILCGHDGRTGSFVNGKNGQMGVSGRFGKENSAAVMLIQCR